MVQHGQYHRASQALVSLGIDQHSAAAHKSMLAKHPQDPPPTIPKGEISVAPVHLSQQQVKKSISSFKAGTAPGPSGLCAEHIKEALSSIAVGSSGKALAAITALVNLLSAGKMLAEVAPFFCGARLFAYIQPDDSHHPITVGNILHHWTSKSLVFNKSHKATSFLSPIQFGVGVKGGTEAVVHTVRSILEDPSVPAEDKWLLQLDLENCHNRVDRSQGFIEIREHFPELSRWFESSYSVQSELLWGNKVILSCVGWQQGDALAGLGTTVVMQLVLKCIKEEVPELRLNAWIQDDGNLIGPKGALSALADILEQDGPRRGLYLR